MYLDLGFVPIPANKVTSREGWQIVKTLTNHSVLHDLEEVTLDRILEEKKK